ncbi:hypothetical protein ACJMK2_004504 [Sinanodonta woodiana]|uniref:Uncharacterized protein n=1 Tax=Sinanodonta woodiana TaxID=1069815 RepID=A0ABD3Y3E6_SINWO
MLNILPIAASTHLNADEAINTDIYIVLFHLKLINIDASFKVKENKEEYLQEPTLQLRLNHICQPDFQTGFKILHPKLVEADRKRAGVTIWWCSVWSKMM